LATRFPLFTFKTHILLAALAFCNAALLASKTPQIKFAAIKHKIQI